jgi:hypothetical protein
MYEYSIMVKTADLNPEALATATEDELSKGIGVALGGAISELSKGMDTFQGGGWEIISHQLTTFEHYLFASFLLRRQK